MGLTSQKKVGKDVTKENSGKGTRTFTTSSIRNSLSLSLCLSLSLSFSREGRLCGVGVVWSLKEREHHHHRFFCEHYKRG